MLRLFRKKIKNVESNKTEIEAKPLRNDIEESNTEEENFNKNEEIIKIRYDYNNVFYKERKLVMIFFVTLGSSVSYGIANQLIECFNYLISFSLTNFMVNCGVIILLAVIFYANNLLWKNPSLKEKNIIISSFVTIWLFVDILNIELSNNTLMFLTLYPLVISFLILRHFFKKKRKIILNIDRRLSKIDPNYKSLYFTE